MKLDFGKVKTYSLKKRLSKVGRQDMAQVGKSDTSFKKFYKTMPNILAAKELRNLSDAVIKARKKNRAVIFMLGAHVIKCGLSPLIIDLMKKKVITAVALNGAGIIHDTEFALVGRTSEDVGPALKDGSFGMAEETAKFINEAINKGFLNGIGIGKAVGDKIRRDNLPLADISILASGIKYSVPVTVHVAVGTDILHQHPSCNGAAVGEGSLIDFRNLIYSIIKLNNGGVAINIGSAVILPEVFLKAVNIARNLGHKVKGFATANFDMFVHYRPSMNVVKRPTAEGGWGCNIIGHHEIMIPLLYQAIIEGL